MNVRLHRTVLAGLLLLLATTATAAAPAITVRSLRFAGVTGAEESRLRDLMETRQDSLLPWGKKYPFDRAAFESDVQRVRAYFIDHGYPNVTVTSKIAYTDEREAVNLTVVVDKGAAVRISTVTFTGFDAVPAARRLALEGDVPLTAGAPLARDDLVAAHAMAVHALEDAGYPYAQVQTQVARVGPMDVAIGFQAEPGLLGHFGAVTIVGNRSVTDEIVRRELLFRPGERYSRARLQATQRKLYGLGLFQFVDVHASLTTPPSAEVPIRITVTEGKHHHVEFGIGYGTEEKLRGDVQWRQVNFLGGARSASVHGRWSSIDRGVRADFTQPSLATPHYQLKLEGQRWYTNAPAYLLVASGGSATVVHDAGSPTVWQVSLEAERDTSRIASDALNDPLLRNDLIALGLNPVTGEQAGTRVALAADFTRNTAGNLLNATHGYVINLHVEQAGRWLPGAFNYTLVSADLRHYLGLGHGVVLATRAQAGDVEPQGGRNTNIPFSKRYFLGGATSIRGWGRYEVSPLSESGLPIGGDSMLMGSTELRTPIVGRLGGVMFLDLGNVWRQPDTFQLADLRYAVGAGLRYETPVGPIRFDFGYQLNPIPGLIVSGQPQTRRWRIHFSIGQAF
ncbi:MAG: BamA/TamA family outer membrane protein [Acidobacteriota bacterium]|nr:BamA/TamA family outer membrane protein [Acidobacteriota bacterium]